MIIATAMNAGALHSALQVFTWIGLAGIAFGVVFLVVGPFIRRWGEDADEVAEPAQAVSSQIDPPVQQKLI